MQTAETALAFTEIWCAFWRERVWSERLQRTATLWPSAGKTHVQRFTQRRTFKRPYDRSIECRKRGPQSDRASRRRHPRRPRCGNCRGPDDRQPRGGFGRWHFPVVDEGDSLDLAEWRKKGHTRQEEDTVACMVRPSICPFRLVTRPQSKTQCQRISVWPHGRADDATRHASASG